MKEEPGLIKRVPVGAPPTQVRIGIGRHGVPNQVTEERYRLPNFWCLHLYRYHAELEIGGVSFSIVPGTVSIIPADTPMVYRFRDRVEHVFCHFQLADEEPKASIPKLQSLGPRFGNLDERLREVAMRPDSSQERCQSVVWDAIWMLTEAQVQRESQTALRHPAVELAAREIESRISDRLEVKTLAEGSGVSLGYLSQLFQQEFGMNVVTYIRKRRAERAAHLLRSSTLPIKVIADSVGYTDLSQFNRLIHREFELSPRQVRQGEKVPPAN